MCSIATSLRTLTLVLLVPIGGLGCSSDEPTSIDGDVISPWSEVQLPDDLPAGNLTAIAFRDGRGLAVQNTRRGGAILLESGTEGWSTVEVDPDLRRATIVDITLDRAGKAAMVGFDQKELPTALAFSERPDWKSVFLGAPPWGVFLSVEVDESGTFLTTGFGINALAAWAGTASGKWDEVQIETPGRPNDKALVDVAFGAGTWVACGFDDGGDGTHEAPFSILMLDEGPGWKLAHTPCGGCGNHEYKAVAIDASGTIYLGGTVTDFSSGSKDEYVAFLRSFSRDIEEWTEIALPNPGSLNQVSDILISSSGDVYLACGVWEAFLLRLPAGESTANVDNIEWRDDDAVLSELGEAADGTIHAVGISDAEGERRPLMLQRR